MTNTSEKKHVYFASDMHFGIPDQSKSLQREKLFVEWLEFVSKDASDIFIMGDLFDFWFEWKYVVPKGYIRLLGTFARLADSGVQLHFFTGNHDMWMFDYFEKELNAQLYRDDIMKVIQGKTLYLSHGDGLGPGDYSYKFIKALFRNKIAQWLYARLHPDFASRLALFFSRKSRYANIAKNSKNTLRESKLTENQKIHALHVLENQHVDFFIFGHQHTPTFLNISTDSMLFNIGNWYHDFTYLRLSDGKVEQKKFTGK